MKNIESDINTPLVSVLLNCYNASKFISKAIESLINQTYNNWELIVWDDGSEDDTVALAKKFQDKRIKLFINKTNVGLGKSRINAIKHLNGSLISILDADDYFCSEKIAKQVEIFIKFPSVGICSTWTKFYNNQKTYFKFFNSSNENKLKEKLLYLNVLPHSSIMYRKNLAIKEGWYSEKFEYAQDYDLTLKLLKHSELHLIKENLTNVVESKNNMTNLESLRSITISENISILEENLKKNISNISKNIIKDIITLNLMKLKFVEFKKNYLKLIYSLTIIILRKPLILFKFNLLKKLDENEKI